MSEPLTLLLWVVLAALGAVGLTIIARNAPGIRGLVLDARKPWACNVCMPLYTVAAMLALPAARTGDWSFGLVYPAAYAVTYSILQWLSQPPGPPEFNIPEDSEEVRDA